MVPSTKYEHSTRLSSRLMRVSQRSSSFARSRQYVHLPRTGTKKSDPLPPPHAPSQSRRVPVYFTRSRNACRGSHRRGNEPPESGAGDTEDGDVQGVPRVRPEGE